MLGAMASRTHLQMKCSSTLLMTGVRDTGLKSDSISVGGLFLGRGDYVWQTSTSRGHIPSLMELLKTAHSGLARKGAKSRSTQVGISSGPVAFPGLRQASLLSTSSTVMTVFIRDIALCGEEWGVGRQRWQVRSNRLEEVINFVC